MGSVPGDSGTRATAPSAGDVSCLTVVVLARDAADTLRGCLDSVSGWHPVMVVLDSRSRDASPDIAIAAGAQVARLEWQGGFGAQRNAAAALAPTDWILFLDSDEEVTPGLKKEIDQLMAWGPSVPAYAVPRRNYHFGKLMLHGGWWPDRQVRLINRLEARYAGAVHERVDLPETSIGRLKQPVIHAGHQSLDAVLSRADSYSAIEAEAAQAANDSRPPRTSLWLLPLLHLMKRFVFLAGFLDGQPGLVEARLQGYYRHLVLVRRRYGSSATATPFGLRLLPAKPGSNSEFRPNVLEPSATHPPVPTDVLAVGMALLLLLLPFHLVIKQILPAPLGESWKEGLIGLLGIAAAVRLRGSLFTVLRKSWLLRLVLAYVALVVLRGLAAGDIGPAVQGMHVDITYVPLAMIMLALPAAQRLPVLFWSTMGAGVVCAAGAVTEVLRGHPFFPSQTLIQQYGRPEVYINATHILRPYFSFDFPTGLGAYLAVAAVVAGTLFLMTRQGWILPVAMVLLIGTALTFSRGPWLGAVVGVVLAAGMTSPRSIVLRGCVVAGAMAILSVASLLTMTGGSSSASARTIRLSESPAVRAIVGRVTGERQRDSLINSGNLVLRRRLPPPASTTTTTDWTIGRARRPVLEEPPPPRGLAVLGYSIKVPDNAVLAWGIALNPAIWNRDKGDGVTFRIDIEVAGQTSGVFAKYIDPKNVVAERRAFFYRLPLFGYAGDTVQIDLMTDSGPRHDASFDWAGWLNPRIVTVGPAASLNQRPYAPADNVSLERPIPPSGPYLASFANWQGDESNADRVIAWQRTWHAWLNSPFIGRGPGSVDQAAVMSGRPNPLITESEFGKVLVETGALGLLLWLALCGLAPWWAWQAFRRGMGLEPLVALTVLSCILVCSLAFQVLEVKQIAAIFWSAMGLAIAGELALRGMATSPAPILVSSLIPGNAAGLRSMVAGSKLVTALTGRQAASAPIMEPDRAARSTPCLDGSAGEDGHPPRSANMETEVDGDLVDPPASSNGDGANAPREERAAAGASVLGLPDATDMMAFRNLSDHLSGVAEVFTTEDHELANEYLEAGWELLACGVTRRASVFVLAKGKAAAITAQKTSDP